MRCDDEDEDDDTNTDQAQQHKEQTKIYSSQVKTFLLTEMKICFLSEGQ